MAPPLQLELDGAALVANWRRLRDRNPGVACGAAIKADGYGLGARGVLARLAAAGCRDFFVATWDEAAALGVPPDVALSVLHGVREEDMAAALASAARPVLNTPRQVARWKEAGGGACDVMVDTGMNRLGLTPADAVSGLLDGLRIATLHSHLACADAPDAPMNILQRDAFRALRGRVAADRYSLANSAGVLLGADYAFDLTRPGLALYGGAPTPGDVSAARQVVHPRAQVVQLREVPAGASIGYGALWRAPAPTRIAILNVGYADGFFRSMGEGLRGITDGRTIEVLGRVSMDLTAIRAPAGIGEGDWIELPFDLPAVAARAGLSQYELLTSLGSRYQRRWT